jgi:hypothetical protein
MANVSSDTYPSPDLQRLEESPVIAAELMNLMLNYIASENQA